MLWPVRIVARGSRAASAASAASAAAAAAASRTTARRSLSVSSAAAATTRASSSFSSSSSSRHWPKHDIPDDAKQIVCDLDGGPVTVAWTDAFLFVEDRNADHGRRALKPATLRDSCACPRCRDPSSGQKTFASTEIPVDIGIADVRPASGGLAITFARDMERFSSSGHEMLLPWASVELALKRRGMEDMHLPRKRSILRRTGVVYWDRRVLEQQVRRIDYAAYMAGGDAFWDAVVDLCRLGIVYLTGVPRDEQSVVRIAERIANVRETFYGRAFDVRAKPDAENVAYTSGHLGLHQDLLYLDPPPMIQALHCLDNSCRGGESLFSDGERVGRLLWPFLHRYKMAPLADHHVPYQYDKNGHHYFSSRRVVEQTSAGGFAGVYWSPPFQGRYLSPAKDIRRWIEPSRVFESLINDPDAMHSRKMEPGECVLFDNLRVMHGRTAFDAAAAAEGGERGGEGGSRWLRGAYIAAEDFLSRASQIPPGRAQMYRGEEAWTPEGAQRELRGTAWHRQVVEKIREIDPSLRE